MGGHKEADQCWNEVAVHSRIGKVHPQVICIHCQKTWHSNSRERVVAHLNECKELPQGLHNQYQPQLLTTLRNQPNPSMDRKRERTDTWFDSMDGEKVTIFN